jgi:hypothetical protein
MEENKVLVVSDEAPKPVVIPKSFLVPPVGDVVGTHVGRRKPVRLVEHDPKNKERSRKPYFIAYGVSDELGAQLTAVSDKSCYKCLGTGIKDWRQGGLRARVCACVLKHNPKV